MLPYPLIAFLSILVFAGVHLWASRLSHVDPLLHGRVLSIGGGIAIAYVFVDLLPKLCAADRVVRESGFFPYIERHVYVLALCGFLLFFLVDRSKAFPSRNFTFYLSLASYALFNFLVGYAVTYQDDPEIQPLTLFTFAMALHYFTNDYTLDRDHGNEYTAYGRWVLISSLFLGWIVGCVVAISPAAIAMVNAFIAGGVIMNVIRHELPANTPHSTGSFLFGAALYTIIILSM